MRINPEEEVRYRVKLARGYLERAERFFSTGDYRECVEASQLAAENSAKAIVALKMFPSWSHDPSDELMEATEALPEAVRGLASDLAKIARELAPEHGLVTYGRPSEGLAPWEFYGEGEARSALEKARKALGLMERILKLVSGQ